MKKDVVIGGRYGHWTVLKEAGKSNTGSLLYLCRCDCGTEALVRGNRLVSGNSKSCGNCQPLSTNTTGVRGVTYRSKYDTYEAQITVKGQRIYLGGYKTLQEAADARKAAEKVHQ